MIRNIFRTIRSATFLSIAIAALLASIGSSPSRTLASQEPQTDPMASVKSVIDQAIVVFKDKQIAPADREQKLRALAENRMDFAEMARSAIGYHWKDFTLDAISVIANYRNQFNRVLNNGGYDKLVSILREKQQALGASLSK